jgi:methionine biosynthesis protein MetW
MNPTESTGPDDNTAGFLSDRPAALRYGTVVNTDPSEVAGLIAGMVPERARVLEVGCGTGIVSEAIQQLRGAHVLGIEPDVERAQAARDRGLEVIRGYLTPELVANMRNFDVIVFADVLEHLPNPMSLLQLGCSALERDGAVVISVPNVAHWSIRWALLRGRFDYEQFGIMDATHLRWFTAASLSRWLQNNGFVVQVMAQSAGTALPIYDCVWPWRLMPRARRAALIRRLVRRWPLLFGCQHVVRATRTAPNLGTRSCE